VIWLAERS